jgi:O-antigen/teichoic acid export membrane protein
MYRDKNIKSKAVTGVFWTGIEKLSVQLIQFTFGIVLARLLSPEDYGVVGMLTIFIAIASTFSDSGFASALIQKQSCSDLDYSTAFYFSFFVSIFCYLFLFLLAPCIADFYKIPLLESVMRVYSLSLIVGAMSSVYQTKLKINLRFKELSLISLFTMLITGIVGLLLAFCGCGVWALVFQSLIGSLFSLLCFVFILRWIPSFQFSRESFSHLWNFGSKLLASGLINTMYANMYALVIGKYFSPSNVGYYNRARQYASLPLQIINDVTVKVNYPVLAKFKDDDEQLLRSYKRLMCVPLYLLYPALIGLALVAEPLVTLMIGEKWLPCVPFLQILCVGYLFTPLTSLNLNLLYVKGRTDLVLKLEFIKKPIAFSILFFTLQYGIYALVIGKSIYEFVAFSINCYYTKKILGYGLIQQLKSLIPIFFNCVLMGLCVYFFMSMFNSNFLKCLFGVLVGVISYVMGSIIMKDSNYLYILNLIKERVNNG